MRDQGRTKEEFHVRVLRVAANSPAKGILCLLAGYAKVGYALTVDHIAQFALMPPGRVEVLLGHLHARGHVEQHSAGGVTTYSARPDALVHYLLRDRAAKAAQEAKAARSRCEASVRAAADGADEEDAAARQHALA